jgi:hypothetical protein
LIVFSGGNQTLIITVYLAMEMLIHLWENGQALFPIVPALGTRKYSDTVPRGAYHVNCRARYGDENFKQENAGEQSPISDIESVCKMRGSYSAYFNKTHRS